MKVGKEGMDRIKADQNQGGQAIDAQDRPFYPFRSAKADCLRCIVEEVTNEIQNYERRFDLRERARKATDQAIFEQTIEAVICDVAQQYIFDPSQQVFVSLSHRHLGHRSRYRAPALGKKLPKILEFLSAPEMAFVEMTKGSRVEVWSDEVGIAFKGKRTTLSAGKRLITRIKKHGIDLSDFGHSEIEEVILLKAAKKGPKHAGQLLEYENTTLTNRYRDEIRALNRWLSDADIMVFDNAVDAHDRRVRRLLNNGRFDQGGRLFGGFWQAMSGSQRLQEIQINQKPVVELDFGQMAIRLLYGKAGAVLPEGDLYRVPGLEAYRDGVKKIVNAALYADKPQSRMPQGSRQDFPDTIEYRYVINAIKSHHRPVSDYFFSGVGMDLMFLESEVLVAVLLDLIKKGITALPIHDALLVSCDDAQAAEHTMLGIFKDKTGVEGEVSMKRA